MKRLNSIDHIWVLLLIFIIILSAWIYTQADWLSGSGRDIIVAIVAVATTKKAINSLQKKDKKEDSAKKENSALAESDQGDQR